MDLNSGVASNYSESTIIQHNIETNLTERHIAGHHMDSSSEKQLGVRHLIKREAQPQSNSFDERLLESPCNKEHCVLLIIPVLTVRHHNRDVSNNNIVIQNRTLLPHNQTKLIRCQLLLKHTEVLPWIGDEVKSCCNVHNIDTNQMSVATGNTHV
jgi:hypothetical protein